MQQKNRMEIEQAENGYSVRVWESEEEDKQDEYGYREPTTLVATSHTELSKIVTDHFGPKKEE